GSSRGFAAVLVAVTAIDLVTLGRGFFPAVSRQVASPPAPPSVAVARRAGPGARLSGLQTAFTANLSDRYGVYDTRAQDLPELKRYTSLFTALGGVALPGFGRTIVPPGTLADSPLFDLFAARYVLDGGGTPVKSPRVRVLYDRPGDRLLENRDAFPRAWVAYSWQSEQDLGRALHRTASTAPASLLRRPVIEGEAPSTSEPKPVTVARITHSGNTSVQVRVTARGAGYLVLDDTYYPGWRAWVDGRAAPIRPANVAFRAVRVGPGPHVVAF